MQLREQRKMVSIKYIIVNRPQTKTQNLDITVYLFLPKAADPTIPKRQQFTPIIHEVC